MVWKLKTVSFVLHDRPPWLGTSTVLGADEAAFFCQAGGLTQSGTNLWRLDPRVLGISMGSFPESGFAGELEELLTFHSGHGRFFFSFDRPCLMWLIEI